MFEFRFCGRSENDNFCCSFVQESMEPDVGFNGVASWRFRFLVPRFHLEDSVAETGGYLEMAGKYGDCHCSS